MISVKCPACGLVDWNVGNCKRCETPLAGLSPEYDGQGYYPGLSEAAATARTVRTARVVMAVCGVILIGLTALGVLYVARKPSKPQWFWSFYRDEPTVVEIFAHNLEVSGGRERLAGFKSFRGEGQLSFGGGEAARVASLIGGETTFVMYVKSPNKTAMEVEMGAEKSSPSPFEATSSFSSLARPAPKITVTLRRGFNGTRGWEYMERTILRPGSTVPLKQHTSRELDGDELERMKSSSKATGVARLEDEYTSLKLARRVIVNWGTQHGMTDTGHAPIDKDIHGHEAYVVDGMKKEDGKSETLYFDTETGLLLRVDFEAENGEGEIVKVACSFGDYKEVEGLKLPHRIHFRRDGESMTLTLEKYLLNEIVPDSTFEMPE